MKKIIRYCTMLFFCWACCFSLQAQQDEKLTIAVIPFETEVNSPFVASVTERVEKVITNTKRFTVVERASYDKIKEELEFQKTEAFLDSKTTVKQDAAVGAQYVILGHVIKMNIYTMKNSDGSVNGYKASSAFTLKVSDVETGVTTEAEFFQTEVSPIAASKEQAVNQALISVEKSLNDYFTRTFPVYCKILKMPEVKKDAAASVVLNAGKNSGINKGDVFIVEFVDILDGKPFPTEIGSLTVESLIGDDFSQCKVNKGGKAIFSRFNAEDNIRCKLLVK